MLIICVGLGLCYWKRELLQENLCKLGKASSPHY
ncbi:hypothetical protein chiPu_0026324, partial [Chiloscyllium punctatum]|nr:hypothetical protein [Chiloscyllium punctatum]